MKLNDEPKYRIQKMAYEGFIMAVSYNFKKKEESRQLAYLYAQVHKYIDRKFPSSSMYVKRLKMKPRVWGSFFDGLMDRRMVDKCGKPLRTFSIEKGIDSSHIVWISSEDEKDISNLMYIYMLGLGSRLLIDDLGDHHLEMFDKIFSEIESQSE